MLVVDPVVDREELWDQVRGSLLGGECAEPEFLTDEDL
jgi:hypothetical protein